jgi:hypothetical protein
MIFSNLNNLIKIKDWGEQRYQGGADPYSPDPHTAPGLRAEMFSLS